MSGEQGIGQGLLTVRLAEAAAVLRSPDTWRVAVRHLLLVVSTLVTLSVLAAAIPTFLGMDAFIVSGGSMRPAVPAGALVVSRRVDPAAVQPGDILTFRHSSAPDAPVTHRVVKVLREADGTVNLLTKGDANATADPEPVATALPVSRMVYSLPYAGWILEFARTRAGNVALIAAPALLLILSIGRRPGRGEADPAAPETASVGWNELDEAAHRARVSEKVIPMVSANHTAPMTGSGPGGALARIAQRPAVPTEPAPRPGLARRLAAALRGADPPSPAGTPEAAPMPVPPAVSLAAVTMAALPRVQTPSPAAAPFAAQAAHAAQAQLAQIRAAQAQAAHLQAMQTQAAAAEAAQQAAQQAAQAAQTAQTIQVMQAMSAMQAMDESLDADGVPPLVALARLRLRSVARLADIMRSFDRVESEASPLLDLMAGLDTVRERFSQNLDEAMRPLTEFADRWDDNLLALQARMEGELPPQIDLAAERRRIAEIRAQVPQRHQLLLDQFDVEKRAIDAALGVFDEQVARLEAQLNAARRTAEAIGDGMRTADFGRTVAFLRRRTEQLALLAERGAASPEEIATALPAASTLAADDEEMLDRSPYLRSVLAALQDGGDAGARAGQVA